MPCFDPKDVIFITNKWDCLENKADGSDEDSSDDEETKTWNALKPMIKKIWESVDENHIFKLNLREVIQYIDSILFRIPFYFNRYIANVFFSPYSIIINN